MKLQTLLFGLAAMGLVLAMPVKADSGYWSGGLMVAAKDRGEARDYESRDRRSAHDRDDRRPAPREAERRSEPEGYGYGYERRRQHAHSRDEDVRDRR